MVKLIVDDTILNQYGQCCYQHVYVLNTTKCAKNSLNPEVLHAVCRQHRSQKRENNFRVCVFARGCDISNSDGMVKGICKLRQNVHINILK